MLIAPCKIPVKYVDTQILIYNMYNYILKLGDNINNTIFKYNSKL